MIKCPRCESTQCRNYDTRETSNNRVRRRKECLICGYRFTTYEAYIEGMTPKEKRMAFSRK